MHNSCPRISPSALVPAAAQCVPLKWSRVSHKHSTHLEASLADCGGSEWAVATLICHIFTCKWARKKRKPPALQKATINLLPAMWPGTRSSASSRTFASDNQTSSMEIPGAPQQQQSRWLCHGRSFCQPVTSTQRPQVMKNTQLPPPPKKKRTNTNWYFISLLDKLHPVH